MQGAGKAIRWENMSGKTHSKHIFGTVKNATIFTGPNIIHQKGVIIANYT